MPIDSTTKVFIWRDNDFGTQILSPSDLNRLRDDAKQAFDLKLDRPDKPWSKGDLLWYDGGNWQILSGGDDDQLLSYDDTTNIPTWKTLSINVVESFEFEGTPADGDILWYDGSDWVLFNRGTQDQVFSLDSNREPIWRDVDEGFNFAGSTQRGDILYYGSSNRWRLLRKGNTGQIMEQGSNDPRWINKPDKSKVLLSYYDNSSFNDVDFSTANSVQLTVLDLLGTTLPNNVNDTRYQEIVSMNYTPNSGSSVIQLYARVPVGGFMDIAQIALFFLIDSTIISNNTVKGDYLPGLTSSDRPAISRNTPYMEQSHTFTVTSSSQITVKLYVFGLQSGTPTIRKPYLEIKEIY